VTHVVRGLETRLHLGDGVSPARILGLVCTVGSYLIRGVSGLETKKVMKAGDANWPVAILTIMCLCGVLIIGRSLGKHCAPATLSRLSPHHSWEHPTFPD